jgi:hypothetical protein
VVAEGDLAALVGEWQLSVDLPGAEDLSGRVVFEMLGGLLVQRTTVPIPEAPDSCCIVVRNEDGALVQHYFDSRGVARLYDMTYDGRTWTLGRSKPDFTPLDFHQRFVATVSDDVAAIDGEWQTSSDGRDWSRDFGMTYRRMAS